MVKSQSTLRAVTRGEKQYRLPTVEEHIPILNESVSIYLSYTVPTPGTAKELKFAMYETIRKQRNIPV